MRFVIEAEGSQGPQIWIEEFRDEARVREILPKRGFKLIGLKIAMAEDEDRLNKRAPERAAPETDHIILSTAFTVAGADIDREIEIVTAECSYGINIFRDLFIEVRDLFGGRSEAVQNVLRDARRTVLSELKREAAIVGADAVIGVDLDYQEISSGKMILLVASGTAVKLEAK